MANLKDYKKKHGCFNVSWFALFDSTLPLSCLLSLSGLTVMISAFFIYLSLCLLVFVFPIFSLSISVYLHVLSVSLSPLSFLVSDSWGSSCKSNSVGQSVSQSPHLYQYLPLKKEQLNSRVVGWMFVVFVSNFGQMELGGAIFLHVLHPSIAKQLGCNRSRFKLCHFGEGHHMLLNWVLPVVILQVKGRVRGGGEEVVCKTSDTSQ